jgi:hypothetical protein
MYLVPDKGITDNQLQLKFADLVIYMRLLFNDKKFSPTESSNQFQFQSLLNCNAFEVNPKSFLPFRR